MGEKDISQKNFESHNDVVADIVNGSLFEGEEFIKADSLIDAQPFSQYKADDGVLHEQERDVAKYCVDANCNVRVLPWWALKIRWQLTLICHCALWAMTVIHIVMK